MEESKARKNCLNKNVVFWRKEVILVFIFIFAFSIINFGQKNQVEPCNLSNQGTGIAKDNVFPQKKFIENKPKTFPARTKPLQIFSKPIAEYTAEARQNCIQGTVKLKITFLASGKIGKIKVLDGLGYGLSERAVEAAKMIKFKPEIKHGKPKTVTKKIKYNFTIY